MKQILKRYIFIWSRELFLEFLYWAERSGIVSGEEHKLIGMVIFTMARLRGNFTKELHHKMVIDWMEMDGAEVSET